MTRENVRNKTLSLPVERVDPDRFPGKLKRLINSQGGLSDADQKICRCGSTRACRLGFGAVQGTSIWIPGRCGFDGSVHAKRNLHARLPGNIYEGLTRRGPDLAIGPALAERWEIVEPNRWRFYLRRGVKFHDGQDFTADDVVFSAARVRAEGSDLKTRLAGVVDIVKVDDYTVDFTTEKPNPILHVEWDSWYMMSKSWAEKHAATTPEAQSGDQEKYTTRHANGTGPFRLVSREAGVKTVAEVNPNWWDKANQEHNLTKVTFTPISSDATRVAALLSGQVDMAYPIPVQDLKRVDSDANTQAVTGPELRHDFSGHGPVPQ